MTDASAPATTWALGFLLEAYAQGVVDVVVSPGSRSQALALAAYGLSTQPGSALDVHVAIDERSAGFVALGLSVHSSVPTILVSTSGSAPAHYLPALLEATHSGIPLIVVSADRPEELRGVGANQTTVQPGMFAEAVCWATDVEAPGEHTSTRDAAQIAQIAMQKATSGAPDGRAGPVHVNVSFREPLSCPIDWSGIELPQVAKPARGEPGERSLSLSPRVGTVVIAGHLAGPEAARLAADLRAPLIAEVHSGAHFGPELIVAYRELLNRDEFLGSVTRVVTVGRPTLSREAQRLLQSPEIEQIVWQRGEPEPAQPSGRVTIADTITVDREADSDEVDEYLSRWVVASRDIIASNEREFDPPAPEVALAESEVMAERSQFAKQEMAVFRRPLTRRAIAKGVWESTWPHDQLVVASSRMIRELDRVAPGKNIPVWSNRGLSGIDGTIATARGIALSRARVGATGVTRVLIGDTAFAHDAGSLLLDQGEAGESRIQVVVVRDGGGSLFDLLEVAHTSPHDAFERVVFAPIDVDAEKLAAAYGWEYRRVTQFGELAEALAWTPGHSIVECVVERSGL